MKNMLSGLLLLTSVSAFATDGGTVRHDTCIMYLDLATKGLPSVNSEVANYLTSEKNWSILYGKISDLSAEDIKENNYYLALGYKVYSYDADFVVSGSKIIKDGHGSIVAVPFLEKSFSYSISDIADRRSIDERAQKNPRPIMRKLEKKALSFVPKCELK